MFNSIKQPHFTAIKTMQLSKTMKNNEKKTQKSVQISLQEVNLSLLMSTQIYIEISRGYSMRTPVYNIAPPKRGEITSLSLDSVFVFDVAFYESTTKKDSEDSENLLFFKVFQK